MRNRFLFPLLVVFLLFSYVYSISKEDFLYLKGLYDKGFYDELISNEKEYLQDISRNNDLKLMFAEAFLETNNWDKALKYYKQLISTSYAQWAYYNIAWIYFNQKKYDKFIFYYKKITDSKLKGNLKLFYAVSLYNLKKYKEALAVFKQLKDSNEKYYYLSDIYLKLKNYREAAFYFKKINDYYNASICYWQLYLKESKKTYLSEILKLYDKVKELKSEDKVLLAYVYYELNKFKKVIELLSSVKKLGNKEKKILGFSYFKVRQYYKAIKVLSTFDEKQVNKVLAISYMVVGNYNKAAYYFKKIGDLKNYCVALYNAKKYDEVLNIVKKAKLNDIEVLLIAANSAYNLGNYKLAKDYLENLLSRKDLKKEDKEKVILLLVDVYQKLGRVDKAYKFLQKYCEESSNLAVKFLEILFATNKKDKILEYVNKLKKFKLDASQNLYVAKLLRQLGKINEALEFLKKAKNSSGSWIARAQAAFEILDILFDWKKLIFNKYSSDEINLMEKQILWLEKNAPQFMVKKREFFKLVLKMLKGKIKKKDFSDKDDREIMKLKVLYGINNNENILGILTALPLSYEVILLKAYYFEKINNLKKAVKEYLKAYFAYNDKFSLQKAIEIYRKLGELKKVKKLEKMLNESNK